jgi:hypothetical protein
MRLLKGYIVPHPPILIVGKDEDKNKLAPTLESFHKISDDSYPHPFLRLK